MGLLPDRLFRNFRTTNSDILGSLETSIEESQGIKIVKGSVVSVGLEWESIPDQSKSLTDPFTILEPQRRSLFSSELFGDDGFRGSKL